MGARRANSVDSSRGASGVGAGVGVGAAAMGVGAGVGRGASRFTCGRGGSTARGVGAGWLCWATAGAGAGPWPGVVVRLLPGGVFAGVELDDGQLPAFLRGDGQLTRGRGFGGVVAVFLVRLEIRHPPAVCPDADVPRSAGKAAGSASAGCSRAVNSGSGVRRLAHLCSPAGARRGLPAGGAGQICTDSATTAARSRLSSTEPPNASATFAAGDNGRRRRGRRHRGRTVDPSASHGPMPKRSRPTVAGYERRRRFSRSLRCGLRAPRRSLMCWAVQS